MKSRTKKTLPRDKTGLYPTMPETVPDDLADLLDLMDDAAAFAERGQAAGAPAFDHGVRVFNQLNAHYQARAVRQLDEAHHGLTSATNGLKVATWWLAGVTVLLGLVEVGNLLGGH